MSMALRASCLAAALVAAANLAHGESRAFPKALHAWEPFFNEAALYVHHDRLNESINRFHRQYANLQRDPRGARNALMDHARVAYEQLCSVVPVYTIDSSEETISTIRGGAGTVTAGRPEAIVLRWENGTELFALRDGEATPLPPSFTVASDTVKTAGHFVPRPVMIVLVTADGVGSNTLTCTLPDRRVFHLEVEAAPSRILHGRILDGDSENTIPARITVTGADGRDYVPVSLLQRRPNHFEHAWSYFYADQRFEARIPMGEARVCVERGFEYEPAEVRLGCGEDNIEVRVHRWVDMVERGWWSVDSHLHYVTYNWYKNADHALMDMHKRAEDINVGNLLPLMHYWKPQNLLAIRPNVYMPRQGLLEEFSKGRYVTTVGEEFRNDDLYGHLVLWNIESLVEPVSTGWMGGPDAPDYPDNIEIADRAREKGGLVSAAHDVVQQVPAMAALGKLDLLDLHRPDRWYDLLNCGFRLPGEIGSDYPANRMGFERAYVYLGQTTFDWDRFIDALKRGRTFISSGAVLEFTADGMRPGDVLTCQPNTPRRIEVEVNAEWNQPLERLELVHNGVVVHRVTPAEPGRHLTFSGEITVPGKGWLAARCASGPRDFWWPVPGVAHTSPIYIDDGTGPFQSAEAARRMLDMTEKTRVRVVRAASFETEAQRAGVMSNFDEAMAFYSGIIENEASKR